MGYSMTEQDMKNIFTEWEKEYIIYAPMVYKGAGAYSETDSIRYGKIKNVNEIEFQRKSDFSYKEILIPISQTLFYYTEDSVKEADSPKKGAIIFLRSCDLHSVKRLDEIYLRNGAPDYYYNTLRSKVKFILLGCEKSFESCFCVDMGTNRSHSYDASLEYKNGSYYIDNQCKEWEDFFIKPTINEVLVTPSYVTENETKVNIPDNLSLDIMKSKIWEEYDSRCINCGRCNFVCPTCTCFTMQDIFYTDNKKAGERRRVWASCMVDGFTQVAGGGSYRIKNGQRMRFKVLHKVYDYKKRFGYHMCVGCGRCDDVCPEYISFSACINKLEEGMKEVDAHDNK